MSGALVVRVGDLLRDPGSQRDVHIEADLGPMATSAARTVAGEDVTFDGLLSSLPGGVTVTGTVTAVWEGECRRCLDPVGGEVAVDVEELAQRSPVDDDVYEIDGDLLDLEPVVREVVLGALPLAPLCRHDCPGPDPVRFPTTVAVDEATSDDRPPDPRWAALADLGLDVDDAGGDAG